MNRYAYANGNPVSNIDPFGLSVERFYEYLDENFNFLYEYLLQIGIDFSIDGPQSIPIIDVPGIHLNVIADISWSTKNQNASVTTDIFKNKINYRQDLFETKIVFDENFSNSSKMFFEPNEWYNSNIGSSAAKKIKEWEVSYETKFSFWSQSNAVSIAYIPNDSDLPTASVSFEFEIAHLSKVAVSLGVTAIVLIPEVVATLVTMGTAIAITAPT